MARPAHGDRRMRFLGGFGQLGASLFDRVDGHAKGEVCLEGHAQCLAIVALAGIQRQRLGGGRLDRCRLGDRRRVRAAAEEHQADPDHTDERRGDTHPHRVGVAEILNSNRPGVRARRPRPAKRRAPTTPSSPDRARAPGPGWDRRWSGSRAWAAPARGESPGARPGHQPGGRRARTRATRPAGRRGARRRRRARANAAGGRSRQTRWGHNAPAGPGPARRARTGRSGATPFPSAARGPYSRTCPRWCCRRRRRRRWT